MPKINKKDETLQYYKLCDMGRFIISLTKSEKSKFRIFYVLSERTSKMIVRVISSFLENLSSRVSKLLPKVENLGVFVGLIKAPTHHPHT